jgi:chromate transporter
MPSRLSPETALTATHQKIQSRPDLRALFLGFSSVGLSGFGGVLPFARRMLVERARWMRPRSSTPNSASASSCPGPNVVNLAVVVGKRYRGLPGPSSRRSACSPDRWSSCCCWRCFTIAYGSLPLAQSMLRGIAAVGCGLLFAMAWRMGMAIKDKPLFLPFTVLTVLHCHRRLRWPMPIVMVADCCCPAVWPTGSWGENERRGELFPRIRAALLRRLWRRDRAAAGNAPRRRRKHHWLDDTTFTHLYAIAQAAPGRMCWS